MRRAISARSSASAAVAGRRISFEYIPASLQAFSFAVT